MTASTGILEFTVYDAGKSPKFPPVVKVNRFFAMAAAAEGPSPLLRKEFVVTKGVRQARVRFSGLGWSELYINGKKVSDDVLSPGLREESIFKDVKWTAVGPGIQGGKIESIWCPKKQKSTIYFGVGSPRTRSASGSPQAPTPIPPAPSVGRSPGSMVCSAVDAC